MRAGLLFLFVPSFAFCADALKPAPTDEAKPEYIKRLEEWTHDKSTPPAPFADPEAFFGLKGRVLVSVAETVLDGGTIKVEFRDTDGLTLRVVKGAAWSAEERKNNLLCVSFPGRLQGQYLLREGGTEERALLALTRRAIEATFGPKKPTARPDIFRFGAAEKLREILAHNLHES